MRSNIIRRGYIVTDYTAGVYTLAISLRIISNIMLQNFLVRNGFEIYFLEMSTLLNLFRIAWKWLNKYSFERQ